MKRFNEFILESKNYYLSFIYNDSKEEFTGDRKSLYTSVIDWVYKNGYIFKGDSLADRLLKMDQVKDLVNKSKTYRMDHFHNVDNSGNYIVMNAGIDQLMSNTMKILSEMGINNDNIILSEIKDKLSNYYLLGAWGKDTGDLSKNYVDAGYWLNGYAVGGSDKFKNVVNKIPVGTNVVIKAVYVKDSLSVMEIRAKGVVTKNYNDGTKLDVNWDKNFKPFKLIESRLGAYRSTVHELKNPELIKLIFEHSDSETDNKVIPPSEFIKASEKPLTYKNNPFGCKQKDGSETSALCVIGKSGSGKTTSTEIALESMEHEYLLYIPIEGEYTFSQYTGEGFEMSSLGEFMMMAQNNPSKCYTVIFDECHRPITISKLNTDLLQALSSKRNRGGDRFVTIDRSTKRMYTTPTEEFPIPLKEKSGKVLVPDNFGIVCLSSNPAVICRNDDFLNRVDLVVFHQSDREVQDLTKLKKLEPIEKNIESIRGLLLSDGKQEL